MKTELNRDKLLKKNFSVGFLMKIVSVGLSFLYIPMLLSYLNLAQYGLWMTILSVISWIYIFDFGMGNGLKIKLSEALAYDDNESAKQYISTTYALVGTIGLVVFLCGAILSNLSVFEFSNWFSGAEESEQDLKTIVFVTFSFAMMNFIVSIYKQILFATNRFYFIGAIDVAVQITNILFLLMIQQVLPPSVMVISVLYGASSILVGVSVSIYIFKDNRALAPSISSIKYSLVRDIFGLGFKFLLIQLATIVIYSTDSIIIAKYINVESVVAYSIAAKMFGGVIIIWYLITGPMTPLFTNAAVKGDVAWISSTIKKMNGIFCVFSVFVLFVLYFSENIADIWLQKEIEYPDKLFLYYTVFVLIRLYGDLYMSFLNSIKVLNMQIAVSIFTAVINIPLSIMFIEKFDMGSTGVILATCISLVPLALIMPIQAMREINKMKNKNRDKERGYA